MLKNYPLVAIVGLPNVGKSTLFNRFLGKRVSIVDETPGVTRDRVMAKAEWNGVKFNLVDTGGIVDPRSGSLEKEIMRQIEIALAEADLILFVVDGKQGLSPAESEVAAKLRRSGKDFILVANKVDHPRSMAHFEHTRMGFGIPFPVSAANAIGTGDLLDAVVQRLPGGWAEEKDVETIRIAVAGRPNSGKSSFVNRILGEERMIVSDKPGTTRDSIDAKIRFMGHEMVIVDTAGLKKKSKVLNRIDFYASRRVIESLERADVVIIMLDPVAGIAEQDFKIAELAEERGKGLLFAVTKWDLVEGREEKVKQLESAIRSEAPLFAYVPVIFISSLTGLRVRKVLDSVLEIHRERSKRVPTPQFNKVLAEIVSEHQPPQLQGKNVKILYGSQVGVAPPRFILFATVPQLIGHNYRRFLLKKMREKMGFHGVPIILSIRGKRKKE
jgi:GTP-binding protein